MLTFIWFYLLNYLHKHTKTHTKKYYWVEWLNQRIPEFYKTTKKLQQFAVAFHSSTATEIHLTNGIIWANKSLSSQVAEAMISIKSINAHL